MAELPDLLKEPRTTKWFSLVDRSKGNISTFCKYQGHLEIAYDPTGLTADHLKMMMKNVVKGGLKIYFDFADVEVPFEKYLGAGGLPPEFFSPAEMLSEKMAAFYKDESEEAFDANKNGRIAFIFTNEHKLPVWAKTKTEVVLINP